ncbi:MAG: transposase [Clostridiales bacterium]|nr:transposase [Clostridiales bacterium]
MPRKAREKIPFGTYLIIQSCIPDKKIFEDELDREEFINILKDKKNQFNFKIYGYCLADDRKYKLIIYDNGSDISKIMKSINISYAYHIKNQGKIFNERYKSTLIKSPEHLEEIISNLHKHKNCCEYGFNKTENLIDFEIYFTPPNSPQERILIRDQFTDEFCMKINVSCKNTENCIHDFEQGKAVIETLAKKYEVTIDQFLSNKNIRNQELLNFRKMTTLSLKEIGHLFGGLSESAVCKIVNRNKE